MEGRDDAVVEDESGLGQSEGAASSMQPKELGRFWMVRLLEDVVLAAGRRRRRRRRHRAAVPKASPTEGLGKWPTRVVE